MDHFFSLRSKTIGIVALTLLALLVVQSLLLSTIAERGFAELEQQQMRADVARVQNTIAADLDQLAMVTGDYAHWDDTYTFVAQPTAAYIENNLYDKVFVDLKINTVVVVNLAGQIVFHKAVDLPTLRALPAPPSLLGLLAADSALLQRQGSDGLVSGVVDLPEGMMLVAAKPIITSLDEGPPRGTLIFGRYLDDAKVRQLSTLVQLPFALVPRDGAPPEPAATLALGEPGSVQVAPLSDDLIAGYTALVDIDKQPVALLRVTTSRAVMQQGQRGITAVAWSLSVAGAVFILVVLLALERLVLRRLSRLSRSVEAIGTRGDANQRVVAVGRDELGRLGGAINAMLAALEQAQAERLLSLEERARIEQERTAINAKRDLLATVSHEMRTPLTPIRGYTDLLLDPDGDPLTPDQREYLQIIRTSALYLGLLIEDLLEFGRVEDNVTKLSLSAVRLPELVAEAVDLLRPAIERKRIRVNVALPSSLPAIEADRKRIAQVLVNLLSNAIKYTQCDGSVAVRAATLEDRVMLEVADTGVGLAPDQVQQLFTRFYRADNLLSHEAGGAGLGLSIAHAFVVLHGGTITVQSQQGVGSVFRVTLPLRQPALAASYAPADALTRGAPRI